jgi:L-seryl-tRNA(Ser) seleniumtransferase
MVQRVGGGWRIVAGESVIGGGSTPDRSLATWLMVSETVSAGRLRLNDPPVIARVEDDRVVIDLRTVLPEEEAALAKALAD